MLDTKNNTPFEPAITIFPDKAGKDTLIIALRGTFTLGKRIEIAEEQQAPVLADEYW